MEMEQKSEVRILQLNYDCLYYVLSYLNVRELMVAEEVCVMFKAVAEDIYKTRRVLDFDFLIDWKLPEKDQKIRKVEAEKIFQRAGPYVETLRLQRVHFSAKCKPLNFVWKYCSKLKSVSFNYFKFNYSICTNLSTVFNNVDEVVLEDCYSVTDQRLQIMLNLQQIKKLTVDSDRIEGDFLSHLQDIQKISLLECSDLVPNKFLNFIQANTQLTHLDITKSSTINETCLNAIARNLINLEELGISCDYEDVSQEDYLPLMDLPKLKGLLLHKSYSADEMDGMDIGVFLERIAVYNRLESLAIDFNYTAPTNKLVQAMTHLTKLKKLTFCDTPRCIYYSLKDLKCENSLQELDVNSTKLSDTGLVNIVDKFKNLRYIDANSCSRLSEECIPLIESIIRTRSHKLVIDLQESVCLEDVEPYNKDILELIF